MARLEHEKKGGEPDILRHGRQTPFAGRRSLAGLIVDSVNFLSLEICRHHDFQQFKVRAVADLAVPNLGRLVGA
jgi:hypothetical protein